MKLIYKRKRLFNKLLYNMFSLTLLSIYRQFPYHFISCHALIFSQHSCTKTRENEAKHRTETKLSHQRQHRKLICHIKIIYVICLTTKSGRHALLQQTPPYWCRHPTTCTTLCQSARAQSSVSLSRFLFQLSFDSAPGWSTALC